VPDGCPAEPGPGALARLEPGQRASGSCSPWTGAAPASTVRPSRPAARGVMSLLSGITPSHAKVTKLPLARALLRRLLCCSSILDAGTATQWGAVVTVGYGELRVAVQAAADTDTEELTQLTNRLRDELLDLDVEAVSLADGGEAPDSSKGIGLLAAGGLVVRFVLRQDLLRSIIDGIRSWLGRQHARSIKLTLDGDSLELTCVSSAAQDRLVELWIMRHGGAG